MSRIVMERFGVTSIGDVLQAIPSAGSAINYNNNNGGNGTTTINIRVIGSNRTLVLIRGKRWAQVLAVQLTLTTSQQLSSVYLKMVLLLYTVLTQSWCCKHHYCRICRRSRDLGSTDEATATKSSGILAQYFKAIKVTFTSTSLM